MKAGYLYVLSHPSDPELYKVGQTTRHPEERLAEHNSSVIASAGLNTESSFTFRSPHSLLAISLYRVVRRTFHVVTSGKSISASSVRTSSISTTPSPFE
ncbi:MAG: GIY-YIG nuclease family protein [Spirochaetes bacterium]|nr:GIY-YIG nuclease family protein [Spirochaetota bacterium]